MSKDLYYTIPQYFISRMEEHDCVKSVNNESDDEFFLYRVHREKFDDVLVWLSDAYSFTDMDFNNRPPSLQRGDYIIIAKPEGGGGASEALIRATGIGVGKLGDFMGALTKREPWTYMPPSWEEKQERKKRFFEKRSKER
ncbi:hypothetical protein EKN06_00210 [Croceicoccus ponticola]|uniref:Uncharacterized protein n=1 Tax=Croceicoccus ponticola TaxID=2217664 RepID=A0A437GZA3_9SPHN|nr:hypothetical protein [Croceicoccus ponticola]RVQ68694.1 hypothetical protein EKN06_00210 [Croceicoccus ponticola]